VNDPSLRRLFRSADVTSQGRKLMATLAMTIGSLRELDTLAPMLESLAVKHVDYGVERRHYDTVGTALIETLSLYFGARFTRDIRAVWIEAFQLVAGVMIGAAYGKMEAVHA
jgi:hemoglobin-like flavoprotein